jgi:hypothetical protein
MKSKSKQPKTKVFKGNMWKQEDGQTRPNLTQEAIILAHLKRTNPEAYKLLQRWY